MRRPLDVLSRLLVALGLVVASLSFAVPAWSAPGPTIRWTGTLTTSPVTVDGTVAVSAVVEASNSLGFVTSVAVDLLPAEGDEPVATLCTATSPAKRVDVDVQWNTTRDVGGPDNGCSGTVNTTDDLAANGRYRLRITAVQGLFDSSQSTRTVDVSNTPGAPTGLEAPFVRDDQAFALEWTANGEPDLSGYLVQSCHTTGAVSCGGSSWTDSTQVGPATTKVSVPVQDAGTYRFRVAAIRPASDTSSLRSEWSNPSAPVTLEGETDDDSRSDGEDATPDGDDDSGGDDPTDGGGSDPDAGDDEPSGRSGGSLDVAPRSASGGTGGGDSGASRSPSRTAVSTVEGGRGLPPRLVKRSDAGDGTYEEALPYGAKPSETASGPVSLLSAERGPAVATVPLAGGLLALVFGLQMRYLSRRAAALALVDGETAGAPDGTAGAAAPWSGAAGDGSFVTHWRRWLRSDDA